MPVQSEPFGGFRARREVASRFWLGVFLTILARRRDAMTWPAGRFCSTFGGQSPSVHSSQREHVAFGLPAWKLLADRTPNRVSAARTPRVHRAKGSVMSFSMKLSPKVEPVLWGAAGGAAALAFVGFMFGGWVTGGKAQELARQQADKAVITALAPICVDKFRHAKNADENLGKLKAISYSWEKGT